MPESIAVLRVVVEPETITIPANLAERDGAQLDGYVSGVFEENGQLICQVTVKAASFEAGQE